MDWLKSVFAQLDSKTVWGVLLLLVTQLTGLNSEDVSGLVGNVVDFLTAVGAFLTTVGISHRLNKWIEAIKEKTG